MKSNQLWNLVLVVAGVLVGSNLTYSQSAPLGNLEKTPMANAPAEHSARNVQPALTLRVYNYAHLDRDVLASAEKVTTSILKSAGVEPVWVECPVSAADAGRYPDCKTEMGINDFVIRLLSASMASKFSVHNEPLGFAQPCPDSAQVCIANIFCARVDELAWRAHGESGRILGHTMAHELGHLLLGEKAHSPSGIMRGVWLPKDVESMRWGELTFTSHQSGQLRDGLLRRARLKLRLTRGMSSTASPTVEVIYQNMAKLPPDMLSSILSWAAVPFKKAGVDVKFTDFSAVGNRSIPKDTPQLIFTRTPLTGKSKKRDEGGESVENRAYVYPNEITTPRGLGWVTAHEIGHSLGLQHRGGRNVMSQDIDLHDNENKLMPDFTPEDAKTLKSKATPVTLPSDSETPSQQGSSSR